LDEREDDREPPGSPHHRDRAGTGQEAISLYRRHRPDIVLMDLHMPGMGGLHAIEAIRDEDGTAKIIVLTVMGGDDDINRAMRAGAANYLLKSSIAADLISTVRRVFAGERSSPSEVANRLSGPGAEGDLSAHDIEILSLMSRGYRTREIAGSLGITLVATQTHIRRLFAKLQVNDRAAAVATAVRRGIVHLP
jgi:DNA-binding NarL/FixJ family response regulator